MSNLDKHLISLKESEILSSEYEKSNYSAINKQRPVGKPDAKTFTYELEVLQDYLNLIREGLEKEGVKNKGVRVTLGKYPESGFTDRLNPDFKGYQTIFFSAVDLGSAVELGQIQDKESSALPRLDFGQICPPP